MVKLTRKEHCRERKKKVKQGVRGKSRKEKNMEKQLYKISLVPITVTKTVPSFLVDGEEKENYYGNSSSMDPDLYKAAMEGNILELVEAVEKVPADRQCDVPASCIQVSPQKNTMLHIATSYRHHEIVNLICKDLPFFIQEKNSKGDTALHIAARIGDPSLVRLIVNAMQDYSSQAILGDRNEDGNTALHEALLCHHEKVAQILIDKNREMSYGVNKEGKSLLYLAAAAGYADIVRLIMENPLGNCNEQQRLRNKSPAHAAIHGRNIGYLEGVNFLLDKFSAAAYQRDRNGYFPIHIASDEGHIDIVQEFLWHCPDSRELLNRQGQNILHLAAKRRRIHLVNYILQVPTLQNLINERDENGNSPLLLATIYQRPMVVSALTWDPRVNLQLVNKDGLTAMDIAQEHNTDAQLMASFPQRLTWLALRLTCAERSQPTALTNRRQNSVKGGCSKLENYKENVNVVLLVSILIATVTFSAGFTIPGGENNSSPNQGAAIMLRERMFHVFVICNTIAMYSSIIVAISLIWAQLIDLSLVFFALKLALPLLGVALTMMSIAFMAAIFVPLCFSADCYILRYISYYPFRLMLYAFGSHEDDTAED
ncbi:hypothetical protein COLO4_30202 [Corchorus olitorius]|uniref:PGG domain-containing protein n=1 Tax=Corchorus olitorius TaxID=93759 RepID=A0A1R3HA37_9ROSI|nr:hypothetical protein COLO4_30202 [Corchorus olitorius]